MRCRTPVVISRDEECRSNQRTGSPDAVATRRRALVALFRARRNDGCAAPFVAKNDERCAAPYLACHWLFHAEGGAHRAVLVELVRRYYNDEKTNLDPAVELGRSHADFGKTIVGHAREALGLTAR